MFKKFSKKGDTQFHNKSTWNVSLFKLLYLPCRKTFGYLSHESAYAKNPPILDTGGRGRLLLHRLMPRWKDADWRRGVGWSVTSTPSFRATSPPSPSLVSLTLRGYFYGGGRRPSNFLSWISNEREFAPLSSHQLLRRGVAGGEGMEELRRRREKGWRPWN